MTNSDSSNNKIESQTQILVTDWQDKVQLSEVRNQYRNHLAGILRMVKNYHGEEEQKEEILNQLISLDEWLREVFSFKVDDEGVKKALPLKIESQLSSQLLEGKDCSIQQILARTQSRYERWVRQTLKKRSDSYKKKEHPENSMPTIDETGLVISEVDGVFLPPREEPVHFIPGKNEVKIFRMQDRLQQLLLFLHENEIFADDIIIVSGKVHEKQIRHMPYTLVEIPKLNKQVLVCDEVGEATFIIKGILPRNLFFLLSKERLQSEYSDRVARVLYFTKKQWEKALEKNLFMDGIGVKIDVRSQEEIRQYILKDKTPEEWGAMNSDQRKAYKVGRRGLVSIYRIMLGERGKPVGRIDHHKKLGSAIFGEHPIFKNIQEAPKGWMNKTAAARLLGLHKVTAKRMIEKYRKNHPEWFGEYQATGRARTGEYISPELIRQLQEDIDNWVDEAPEGWMTVASLAKALKVSHNYVEKLIEIYGKTKPECFAKYLNGIRRPCVHMSPELVKIVSDKILSRPDYAPDGWYTNGGLAYILGVDGGTVHKIVEPYRHEQPDWFKNFLEKNCKESVFYAPDLVEIVIKKVEKARLRQKELGKMRPQY